MWYAFNLSGHAVDVPVPLEARQRWRLRLSTDAEAYGGSGMLVHTIAAARLETEVSDAPKRLMAPVTPIEPPARTVRVAAWSASVYVREQTEADA